MPAHVIARIDVTDPAGNAHCSGRTVALAGSHGGRFLDKGGAVTRLEDSGTSRHVVIAFPDAAARAFHASPDYQAILPLALRSSRRDLVIVEGV